MITLNTIYQNNYTGLSTDVKPADVKNGDEFFEIDTNKIYIFDEQNKDWLEVENEDSGGSGGGNFTTAQLSIQNLYGTNVIIQVAAVVDGAVVPQIDVLYIEAITPQKFTIVLPSAGISRAILPNLTRVSYEPSGAVRVSLDNTAEISGDCSIAITHQSL